MFFDYQVANRFTIEEMSRPAPLGMTIKEAHGTRHEQVDD